MKLNILKRKIANKRVHKSNEQCNKIMQMQKMLSMQK